jgi:radical SAM protein with 4Fe4S-binding SPASM domain
LIAAEQSYPLGWIGEFVGSIRPHVALRREDSLFILLPNQAYRLNSTGVDVLEHIFSGGSIESFLEQRGNGSADARRDLYHFFCDLRALVSGCLGDGHGRKAVEQVPFQAPFSSLPVLSEVALTYRCNLACCFCYAGCGCRRDDGAAEMTTSQAVEVLRIIRQDAGVPSVSFTGGEPTLRPDLPELISEARRVGLRVNLITNATLVTPELAAGLASAGLYSAQVSIEGDDAGLHDSLTAVPGSFERSWRGIENLLAAGVKTQTNTTLNGLNAGSAERIVEMLAARGMRRFAMNMLMPCGSSLNHDRLRISYSEIGGVVAAVHHRARELDIEFLWYSPTPYCIFNPISSGLGNKGCAACDGLLSVNPTGDVLPCSSFEYGVGNLLQSGFHGIWDSARALYWRMKRYSPPQCGGCPTIEACSGACPLYWNEYGTAELDAALSKEAV